MLGNESSIQTSMKLSFLLQMLIRSSKFLTVILSVFLFKTDGHEEISRIKLAMALLFTFAIFVFHIGDSHKGASNEIFGLLLGFASLLCDCCVSHFQTKLKKKHQLSYWELVQGSYTWCLIFAVILAFTKNEMFPALNFMQKHPSVVFDLMCNEIVSSLSLLVIFYHIHSFGSVSMAKIASVRKSLSVVISIVAFGHVMNGYRIAGLTMMSVVFLYEAYLNIKESKAKVKTN